MEMKKNDCVDVWMCGLACSSALACNNVHIKQEGGDL